jgi:hypothetical protein
MFKETAMQKRNYIAEIDSRVAGIPCRIGVTEFNRTGGSYSYNADSDIDYYGYTEMDFEVLDRRGRPAAWLERKLDKTERADIEYLISDYFS